MNMECVKCGAHYGRDPPIWAGNENAMLCGRCNALAHAGITEADVRRIVREEIAAWWHSPTDAWRAK